MPCYDWNAPDLGDYVACIMPTLGGAVTVSLVAITIGLALWMVFQTVTAYGSGDSRKLQELPQKWLHLIFLVIVTAGGGGFLVYLIFNTLGAGNPQVFYDDLINLIKTNL